MVILRFCSHAADVKRVKRLVVLSPSRFPAGTEGREGPETSRSSHDVLTLQSMVWESHHILYSVLEVALMLDPDFQ